MNLPTLQEIEALHHKYAPTEAVFDLIYTHCQVVGDIAMQLIAHGGFTVDAELVRVGCLLHDIGVYPLFDKNGVEQKDLHYITHGVRGEEILKAEGLPEVIWRFASHHTGVGLTKDDITKSNLPLPLQDYNAETPEERLIMYADKFHSKTEPVAKFGEHKAVLFEQMAQEFGVPELEPLVAKYGHQVRTN
jgi:uncharacterized protein